MTALAGSPYAVLPGGYAGMAISPDGTRLYATSYATGSVYALAIAADGALSQLGLPVGAGVYPTGLAITADGEHVYSTGYSSSEAYAFAVQPDGSLAADGPAQSLGGAYADFQSLAIPPDQPATARLTSRTSGAVSTLDASASTDADGTVASYAWDFGDGTTATTTTPTATHRYADGTHTATVTLTDDEGCSTSQVGTGLSVLCNGSSVARATSTVVTSAVPSDSEITGVSVVAKAARAHHALRFTLRAGAAQAVTVTAKGFAEVRGVEGRVKLEPVTAEAAAGGTATLTLVARKHVRGERAAGRPGTATLRVRLTDVAGHLVKRTVTVRLT